MISISWPSPFNSRFKAGGQFNKNWVPLLQYSTDNVRDSVVLTKWQDNKESFFPSPDKKKYSLKSQKMHPGFYYVSKTLKIKVTFTF